MSVYMTTSPPYHMAGYVDYNIIGDTNRHKSVETDVSIVGVYHQSGGFTGVNTTGEHGFVIGDVVLIDGTTNYDGYHTVLYKSPSTFVIDTAYVEETLPPGSIATRANRNFKFKIEIINTDAEVIATKYTFPVYGIDTPYVANFRVNISKVLQKLIPENTPISSTYNVVMNETAGYLKYKITVTEIFDDADGLSKTGDVYNSSFFYVHNSLLPFGEASFDEADAFGWMTNAVRTTFNKNSYMFLPAIIQSSVNPVFKVKVVRYDIQNPTIDTIKIVWLKDLEQHETISTPEHGRVIIPINASNIGITSLSKRFTVTITDNEEVQISETLTFDIKSPAAYETIVFQNLLGCFDTYDFIGIESKQMEVDRKQYTSSGTIKTHGVYAIENRTYYSGWLTNDEIGWLKELLLSKHIFRREGGWQRINVLTNEISFDKIGELNQLVLKFQEQETKHN